MSLLEHYKHETLELLETTTDARGGETETGATPFEARTHETNKLRRDGRGQEVTVVLVVFADTALPVGALVRRAGTLYRVLSAVRGQDVDGQTHFYRHEMVGG